MSQGQDRRLHCIGRSRTAQLALQRVSMSVLVWLQIYAAPLADGSRATVLFYRHTVPEWPPAGHVQYTTIKITGKGRERLQANGRLCYRSSTDQAGCFPCLSIRAVASPARRSLAISAYSTAHRPPQPI
jgi:hypothetical protein